MKFLGFDGSLRQIEHGEFMWWVVGRKKILSLKFIILIDWAVKGKTEKEGGVNLFYFLYFVKDVKLGFKL